MIPDPHENARVRLWHDDVRLPPDGWLWARRNEEAIEILTSRQVVECSLDHDLGYHDVVLPDDPDELMEVYMLKGHSEQTGLQLVDWMVENDKVPPVVRIHSWNPVGAANMAARLARFGHSAIIDPFNPLGRAAS